MFANLEDFFKAIADTQYVVLRNYEEFDNLQFLTSHPDIDILCQKPQILVKRLSLQPRRRKEDGIHYYAVIHDTKVAVDLRHVGDGYLDSVWESRILQERVLQDGFFVMDPVNYFYSLLYHVIIQKNVVAPDYVTRLENMAKALNISYSLKNGAALLDTYIDSHGYHYTYPEYAGTIFNTKQVRRDLVEKNTIMQLKRLVFMTAKKTIKRIKG